MCRSCRHQCSVSSGTIFEKTRTPLGTWFAAIWYVVSQKHGVSALGLQRALGLGSYQTAWTMLHRLRRAMVRPDRERLLEVVEVDETFVGGRDTANAMREGTFGPSRKGPRWDRKTVVAIAVEVHQPRGFGRARLRRLPVLCEEELVRFVCEAVSPGSDVRTDGSPLYRTLPEHGYIHDRTVTAASQSPAHVTMPAVSRVASLLKRWLMGTHQGAVRPPQLDYYLDEFTFRFNRRTSRSRGLLFYRLLEQAVVTEPTTYRDIVTKRP